MKQTEWLLCGLVDRHCRNDLVGTQRRYLDAEHSRHSLCELRIEQMHFCQSSMISFTSASICFAASCRVMNETRKNTRKESTIAIADAVTPEGRVNIFA